jgi:DNA-binding MarR family transcriptional regulator
MIEEYEVNRYLETLPYEWIVNLQMAKIWNLTRGQARQRVRILVARGLAERKIIQKDGHRITLWRRKT